ncbi:hypothetical protein K439DRAFT_1650060 [Ramaria rubella]|nr:hypothetical protein K439DRAFT_1650060 [Ramaria rubella]
MSHKTFKWLCQILQPMDIFQSRGKRPQWPVQFQLACFLSHYAQQGSDSLRVAQQLSLGHGTLGLNYLIWPDKDRKHQISDVFEAHSDLGFFNGNKINVQATVDHEKRFTSFDLGWPGSMPDVTIFKASYIWNNHAAHFAPGEYILADKGE